MRVFPLPFALALAAWVVNPVLAGSSPPTSRPKPAASASPRAPTGKPTAVPVSPTAAGTAKAAPRVTALPGQPARASFSFKRICESSRQSYCRDASGVVTPYGEGRIFACLSAVVDQIRDAACRKLVTLVSSKVASGQSGKLVLDLGSNGKFEFPASQVTSQ